MELKQYQADSLAILRRFFEQTRVSGPSAAYDLITSEPDQARLLGRFAGKYVPLHQQTATPYVCLRVPTGGGKTVLAASAISVLRDSWLEKDYPMVLWLVPSNTIRMQTVDALRNNSHSYRQVLDHAFDGRVRVFDISRFEEIGPTDIRDNLCVVVGTIQTLRVSNTEGRRVYAHNENLEPHFAGAYSAEGMELTEDGTPKYSFANLMHVHRPLMIVDEAHNAVSGLSREMQARVNPSAVVEFSATPRVNSNILHSVSAQELKQAEMIKLPIMLAEHDTWQDAVTGAVAARAALEEAAQFDRDYIRPIVLFQAQSKDQEVTVDVLKTHLVEVECIPADRIAVATGSQRELDGIDLFDPKCPVEFVITVEALKEGWDCSFAYVFCSVSRIQSAVDVEQLLGRVLRMPYARRRKSEELNRAYAFLSETSFGAAARSLADKLVSMGFEEEEALDSIYVQEGMVEYGGLLATPGSLKGTFVHRVQASDDLVAALGELSDDRVVVHEVGDGMVEIGIIGPIEEELRQTIVERIPEAERARFAQALEEHRERSAHAESPAESGAVFVVPRLECDVQGELEFADADVFMEYHEWSLLAYPARLGEDEFRIRETARSFEIDLDGNHVMYHFASEDEQLALDVDVDGWTPEALVLWLDKQVRQPDIDRNELLRWLRDMVEYLTVQRSINLTGLMRCKYILARKVREKIATIRATEREKAYQQYLFAPTSAVSVNVECGFEFTHGMYIDQARYRGRWRPTKHFLGADSVPAFDGNESGEEFQCAQALDSLPTVKYWVRNVARHPSSFWLPTATDRFYPDFVALLEDGRTLVVEYKGAHLASGADTNEKRVIGELWERESAGRGLFLLVEKDVDGLDMRAQMQRKIVSV